MSAKQPLQAFRYGSTDKVTHITTLIDPKTGERIVLWSDITSAFKKAESICIGDLWVPFLKDENLEQCLPLRIAYHPDHVLEVTTGGDNQVGHTRETPTSIGTLPVDGVTENHVASFYQSSTGMTDTNTLTRSVEALQIAETITHNHPLVGYSAGMTQDAQLILAQNQQLNPSLPVVMSGQCTITTIMQSLNQINDRQEQLVHKQDHMLQMQQQALDRLAIIQSSVQALVTQTFELHEYPIPRLFIVLPKTVGLSGKLKGILSEQFRLYFLCECGTHTMSEDTKTPHHIHLAKHDGYDLEKPSVFFERYGTYVLTIMHMIKYGIAAAGLIVPPLASSGIVDGLDTAQKHMEDLKKNIRSLVDDTIKFLDDMKTNNGMGDEVAADHTEFDQLEALEGADLRQLESYLKVKDQGRVLGNLYRIVTSEGHVKWVCFDHYRASYRETAIKYLREVVGVNHGKYIEETGRIEITIGSNILAKQFYDAMIKARWIQELEIMLGWDATMDDLRTLANAVTKANVICLTVNGTYLKSPTLDVVNRNRRYDPIMQLASNHRVQSLELQGFESFFSRVSKSSLAPAPKLRMFSMVYEGFTNDKAVKSFYSFIDQCSALTSLELQIRRQSGKTIVIEGKLHDIALTIDRMGIPNSDTLQVIREHHLTRLSIKNTPQEADEGRLVDILRHSPLLSHLQIGCNVRRFHTIIELVVSTRERIVQERGPSSLRTLELMEENLVPFDVLAIGDSNDTQVQSRLTFPEDSNSFDMRTWIRLKNEMSITDEDPVYDFVRQYGWSIVFFNEDSTNNNTSAAILDDIPNTRTTQLESLWIRPKGVFASGLDRLDKVIERSPNFKDLGLNVNLGIDDEFKTAQALLSRHGRVLSMLSLGHHSSERRSWIASTFPTRNSFPTLVSLEIWPTSDYKLQSDFLSWIVAMASAPPQGLESHSLTQSLLHNVADERSTHDEFKSTGTWTPLRKILLRNIEPGPEEWKALIEAIDFSTLEYLDLRSSNFSQEKFQLLVDRISGHNLSKVPLRTLNIANTDFVNKINSRELETMLAELRKKVPSINIITTR